MYKFIGVFLVFVLGPTLAGAWGLLPYCVTRGPDGATKLKTCFVESFAAAGKTPCLNLTVNDQKKRAGAEGAAVQEDVAKEFQRSFDSWINAVRGTISQSGREAEFADFLSEFPVSVRVRVQNALPKPPASPVSSSNRRGKKKSKAEVSSAAAPENYSGCVDITAVVGWEQQSDAHTCADADAHSNTIRWYTHILTWFDPNRREVQERAWTGNSCHAYKEQVLAHEIGHWLGLTDLYWNKLEDSAGKQVMVNDFSLLPMGVNSREMERVSLMGTANNHPIGCDDVDAVVNMWDVLNAKKGKISPRWENGWASFCPQYNSFRYAYGQPYRNAKEYADNKKRIEAILFFEKSYLPWYQEYDHLDKEINVLTAKLNKAPRPLTTADLMDSAKLNYLQDRQTQVGNVYVNLQRVSGGTPLLEQYQTASQLVNAHQSISPGSALFDRDVLANYKPKAGHLADAVVHVPHMCFICAKPIDSRDENRYLAYNHKVFVHQDCTDNGRFRAVKSAVDVYAKKYGYDREQTSVPSLTYNQLRAKAIVQGIHVNRTDFAPAVSFAGEGASPLASASARGGHSPSAPAVAARTETGHSQAGRSAFPRTYPAQKGTRVSAVPVSASGDQFSESSLAGRPRANVKAVPVPAAAPVSSAPEAPKELRCSVCGKPIVSETDAYIPPEKSRGPVHKHSECAFKYFSRFYSVDNASLDSYGKFYFLNEPSGVTAAKGLMKKLGLTPAEVKTYTESARETARLAAQRQQEDMERSKKWSELKAAYEAACSGSYVHVVQADKEKFVYDNRVALNSIRRKQKEDKKLTKKERLVWQNYQSILASEAKQKKCEDAAKAWKSFNAK